MSRVRDIAKQIAGKYSNECEKATALHDFVRDNIKFGFNRYFDLSRPFNTLDIGIGHCNPKGELLVALLREADLEAFNHFVVLPKEILRGTVSPNRFWLVPAELSHCYTEVKVEGVWYKIDSYILDGPLFKAARAKLSEMGRTIGYGTHGNSTIDWDGKSDAFSQFDKDMMIEDHGRVDNLETYYHSPKCRHKIYGISLNTLCRIIGKSLETRSKLYLNKLRDDYSGNRSI